ncbi:cysteine sulfinate desulfinase, partial [Salmonella enterica subsp. enterica serovar Typhimurium]
VLWLRYRIKKNCCVTLRVALIGKRNIYILLSWGSAWRS